MASRTIVIGDVHGCLSELRELFAVLELRPEEKPIFTGDLLDRGDDPNGVVRMVVENGWPVVQANHEEKALRWLRHEEKCAVTGKKNPMRAPFGVRRDEWLAITPAERAYLESRPPFIRFMDGSRPWLVTHAGIPTDGPIEEADVKTLIRTRRVDGVTGKYASKNDPREIPEGSVYWSERWKGPESVVHGHIAQDGDVPRVDEPVPGIYTMGIDTGCCFGGNLTAAVFTGTGGLPAFVQVKAKKIYYDRNNFHADDP